MEKAITTGGTIMRCAYQIGPYKKFSSEYTWTLYDWSLLYESNPRKGADSTKFEVNGTPGYTCDLSLYLPSYDWAFVIKFSETANIQSMKVTSVFNGNVLSVSSYNNPIPLRMAQQMGNWLDKSSPNYILKDCATDTLRIVVTITIVSKSDLDLADPIKTSTMRLSTTNPILPKFKTMLEHKILCDVTFVLGDKRFDAHKLVLAAQSNVFEAMFSSGMKEETENVINISNTSPEVFQEFLNYLYSGELPQLENRWMVGRMIALADFYNVIELKIMCENFMLESLSEDTVIEYIIVADQFNCETLKNEALCLIRSRADVLEKALLKEDDATVKRLKEILSENQPKV